MRSPSGGPGSNVICPLEFLSNIIIRPFTHAVRLFANMFAGHMLLCVFSIGTLVPVRDGSAAPHRRLGVMTIVLTGFEMFIQFLQAFLFAMLAAMYIQGALDADH